MSARISMTRGLAIWLVVVIGVAAGACGGDADGDEVSAVAEAQNPDCIPDDVEGLTPTQPDRRIEDIIEVMTGERQTGDLDPVEETITDPNFGGVYGDFRGGVVVAVLDCTKIDVNQLAQIAGGAGYIHIVEVPYTFKQVDEFRDKLVAELRANGIAGDIGIESTLTGRHIEVRVLDAGLLPREFAEGVPEDVYSISVVEGLMTEQ